MNLSIPETWQTTTLAELAIYVLGGDWGKDVGFESPDYTTALCIRGAEFRNWNEDKGSTASPRKIKNSSLSNRVLKDGDILVEISGGGPDQPVGRTVLIDKAALSHAPEVPKICTNFVRLLRTADEIDSRFLNSYLMFFYASGEIRDYQAGSNNLRNLKFNDYLGIDIPIPPLNEQHRIVAKIEELFSELDKGIENLKTARAQLKVYRQALLKHAFEGKLTAQWRAEHQDKLETADALLKRIQQERAQRYQQQLADWQTSGGSKPKAPKSLPPLTAEELAELPELPDGWGWVRVGEIADVQLGRQRSPNNRSNLFPTKYIRAGNLTDNGLDLKDVLDMEFEPQERARFLLKAGDVLLSEASGSANQVGKPAVWRGGIEECCFQNTVIRVRSLDELSEYLFWIFKTYYISGVFSKLSGGVGINHLSAGKLESMAIPLVAIAESKKILELINEKLSLTENLELTITTSLQQAETLRQSILKKAFSGQLVPQDPHDDPASALLTRIRVEREESTKMKRGRKSV